MEQSPSPHSIKASDTHRKAVRRLMRLGRSGTLATICSDGAGGFMPLASLATYATDTDGSPLFLLSTLADHTQALLHTPHCSFLIEQASGLDNPQTGERVSLCGVMEQISDKAQEAAARSRFLAQNPAAQRYAGFGDFALWRLQVNRAHYVGGFARATWIKDGLLADPILADTLAALTPKIIAHMNSDHADAVAHYAAVLLRLPSQGSEVWQMTALDCDGLHLCSPNHERSYYLPFDTPLTVAADCQPTLIALAEKARRLAVQMAFERS